MKQSNMKYIIIILTMMSVGCKCTDSAQEPKFEPLPPEKLHDLLHISDSHARKSITIKDYIIKEDC